MPEDSSRPTTTARGLPTTRKTLAGSSPVLLSMTPPHCSQALCTVGRADPGWALR